MLAGPPYSRPFAEIGRMNRQQINVILRNRDRSGKLDIDGLLAAQREREGEPAQPLDGAEQLRFIRRVQGWPEYLIDKMLRQVSIPTPEGGGFCSRLKR